MNSLPSRIAALSALACSFLLLACPGGSGTVGGGAPVPADQLGKAYVEKICAAIQSCCNQNGFAEEAKTCTQGAAALQGEFDKDRAKSPNLTYDAQKAGNCIAKIAAAYGTCDPKSGNDSLDNDPDCDGFQRGNIAAGGSCTSGAECAAIGSTCYHSSSSSSGGVSVDGGATTTSGMCISLKAPSEGDPCLSYGDFTPSGSTVYGDCRSGDRFYCDPESKTCKASGGVGTKCVTPTGAGASFTSYDACTKDATCDTISKKCVARLAVGEACTGFNDACADTAFCDPGSKKCVARKAAGEACDYNAARQCAGTCDRTTKKCTVNSISRDVCGGKLG